MREYARVVKFIARVLLLSGLLCPLVTGITPTTVRAQHGPSSTDPPKWYTQTVSDGMLVNGVGSDTTSAFLNALGALARRLDPSVERMSEELEGASREKMTRVLAETSFDSVTIASMSEYYTYRTRSAYSGRSDLRRIVRVRFPLEGDTECEYRSYLEEVQSEIGTSSSATPDRCDWNLLEQNLARKGVQIIRNEPRLVRRYVQVRFQDGPVKINDNFDTAPGSDTGVGKTLEDRSLKENKKAMEREMERNLRDRRSGDTATQHDTSAGGGDR